MLAVAVAAAQQPRRKRRRASRRDPPAAPVISTRLAMAAAIRDGRAQAVGVWALWRRAADRARVGVDVIYGSGVEGSNFKQLLAPRAIRCVGRSIGVDGWPRSGTHPSPPSPSLSFLPSVYLEALTSTLESAPGGGERGGGGRVRTCRFCRVGDGTERTQSAARAPRRCGGWGTRCGKVRMFGCRRRMLWDYANAYVFLSTVRRTTDSAVSPKMDG
eukprot:360973-Chlamydomonas_euryale.AAC.12